MNHKQLFLALALCASGILASVSASADELKSPRQVTNSLKIFAHEYDDMTQRLERRQYDRLPHENLEFQEGGPALREAIANEPAAFKAKVEPVLAKTLAASSHVAELSKSHDEAQIKAAVAALADSMKELNALFPQSVRASPGS
jgi:cytochrome c556